MRKGNSAGIAYMRLINDLNPVSHTRFARQCGHCKWCYIHYPDDHLCLKGEDMDSLEPCFEIEEEI